MVHLCAVFGCNNNSRKNEKGLRFLCFPYGKGINIKKIELINKQRKQWYNFLKRDDIKIEELKTRRICSAHFVTGTPAKFDDTTNVDWVPTLKAPRKKSNDDRFVQRYRRIQSRDNQKHETPMETEEIESVNNSTYFEKLTEMETKVATLSDTITAQQQEILLLKIQNQSLKEENERLKNENIKVTLKEESFDSDDDKLKFYTGLPSLAMFNFVLDSVKQSLYAISVKNMDNFQKLLLAMMKLRLNLPYKDLAYRFNISNKSASSIFQKVVVLLKHSLQNLIHWPDRECLQLSTPRSFRSKFGNSVVVIIDCFEIATQKPSTLRARNQSWSEYKHHYTAKYLIGITPYGAISFISDGFSGHTTDTEITQQCGIVDKLIRGDVVLADRGFLVKELVALKSAELKTPAFKNGKDQLHPNEIEESRDIASVRIHVERVIGCIKQKFTLLEGPVPITLLKTSFQNLTLLDYAVHVACILNNLCPSVVNDSK